MQIKQVYIVDSFSYQNNATTCIIYKAIIWFKHDFKAFVTQLTYTYQIMFQSFYQQHILDVGRGSIAYDSISNDSPFVVVSIGYKPFVFQLQLCKLGLITYHMSRTTTIKVPQIFHIIMVTPLIGQVHYGYTFLDPFRIHFITPLGTSYFLAQQFLIT